MTPTVHIMLDIETLDTTDFPALVQIAAVEFDPHMGGEQLSVFQQYVSPLSCMKLDASVSLECLKWWSNQPTTVSYDVLGGAFMNGCDVRDAIQSFKSWVESKSPEKGRVKIWGNGNMFDNLIIRNYFNKLNIEIPWTFRDDFDMRTLMWVAKQMNIDTKQVKFEGDQHNAVDDASHQARMVSFVMNRMDYNNNCENDKEYVPFITWEHNN